MLSPRDHHPQQTQIQSLELYAENDGISSSRSYCIKRTCMSQSDGV